MDGYRIGPGINADDWIRYIDAKNEAKVWKTWNLETRCRKNWKRLLEKFTQSDFLMGFRCGPLRDDDRFYSMNPAPLISKYDDLMGGKHDDRAPIRNRLQATGGVIWHCRQYGGDPMELLKRDPGKWQIASYELLFAVEQLQTMID